MTLKDGQQLVTASKCGAEFPQYAGFKLTFSFYIFTLYLTPFKNRIKSHFVTNSNLNGALKQVKSLTVKVDMTNSVNDRLTKYRYSILVFYGKNQIFIALSLFIPFFFYYFSHGHQEAKLENFSGSITYYIIIIFKRIDVNVDLVLTVNFNIIRRDYADHIVCKLISFLFDDNINT